MLLARSRPIVVICIADGSHFARERRPAFTPWHLDAVSGSHPPHLLSGGKPDLTIATADFRVRCCGRLLHRHIGAMDVGAVEAPTIEERAMQTITTIGLDIAK